ncbi:hypothetical protein KEM55_006327 [Ascosphaera atra]|nr:hypothetical protein KEM55_006327 [Ascosphaera atra]
MDNDQDPPPTTQRVLRPRPRRPATESTTMKNNDPSPTRRFDLTPDDDHEHDHDNDEPPTPNDPYEAIQAQLRPSHADPSDFSLDDAAHRSRSIMNLTSSTLLGIYGDTVYDDSAAPTPGTQTPVTGIGNSNALRDLRSSLATSAASSRTPTRNRTRTSARAQST